MIRRNSDSTALRLHTTPHPTGFRLPAPTLMPAPVHRLGVARQNAGYNKRPQAGHYRGTT